MRVLGIDPGYDRLGIAIVDKIHGSIEQVIYSDCLQTSKKDSIYDRLKSVGSKIEETLEKYNPDFLAIENLFMAKNQKTAMRVSEARGIIIYEALRKNIPVFEYTPMEIKIAVTGDGSSDKLRITKMIGLIVKIPKKKILDDEYDAIAVAITHIARYPQNHSVAKKI